MSWKKIYSSKNIKNWNLPASTSISQGYVRGLILTWSEMEREFNSSDDIWYVVCDVLILDDNPIIDDSLYIFARRIEIKNNIAFLISDIAASVTIVTQEIIKDNFPAALEVSFISDNQNESPVNIKLTTLPNEHATIFASNFSKKINTFAWTRSESVAADLGDNLSNGEPLQLGLVSIFQLATLISKSTDSTIISSLNKLGSSPLRLAINQFAWVATISGINEETFVMAGEAQAQLAFLVDESQGVISVPPLDFTIYRDAAIAHIDVLKSLSKNYEKWRNLKRSNENWLKQAKLMVELQSNEGRLQSQLEDRAENKLRLMQGAENEAKYQLGVLRNNLIGASNDFKDGVAKWKEKEERTAKIQLVLDIVKFGVSVGKIATMVAVPGASSAVSIGANSSEEAKTPSQFDKVKTLGGPVGEAGGAVSSIIRDIAKIIEIGETADAMNTMTNDTLKAIDNKLDEIFTPLKGLNVVTGGKQVWRSLLVTMDEIFIMADELFNKIDGGSKFRVEFRKLVIGADAYCSTRLAVAKSASDLVTIRLQKISNERAGYLMKNTEKEFQMNEVLYEQLEQEVYGRVLDVKRTIYLKLQQYQQAFYFFTLNKTNYLLPNITASVIDFIKESAKISGLKFLLNEVSPIPQNLHSLHINIPIKESNRNEKSLIVQIDENNSFFKPYARIRIDKIEINLENSLGQRIIVPSIKIGTSGVFRDIMPDGSSIQFSGNPFIRTLTYDDDGNVVLGSNIYSRFTDAIFKPTPFSTWVFEFPDKDVVREVSALVFTISGAASARKKTYL